MTAQEKNITENVGGTPGARSDGAAFVYSESELDAIASAVGRELPLWLSVYLADLATEFSSQATVADFKRKAMALDARLAAVERASCEMHEMLLELGKLNDRSTALLLGLAQKAEAERRMRREFEIGNRSAPDRQWLLLRLVHLAVDDLGMSATFARRNVEFGQEPYGPIIDFLDACAGPPMAAKGQRMTAEVAANAVTGTRVKMARDDEALMAIAKLESE